MYEPDTLIGLAGLAIITLANLAISLQGNRKAGNAERQAGNAERQLQNGSEGLFRDVFDGFMKEQREQREELHKFMKEQREELRDELHGLSREIGGLREEVRTERKERIAGDQRGMQRLGITEDRRGRRGG